ncbi:hypothetical protein C0R05_18115 [Streptomyces albidoflavus]|nr:hypothetical protein C0R05_18115 [Streptomyces albidoflavus]
MPGASGLRPAGLCLSGPASAARGAVVPGVGPRASSPCVVPRPRLACARPSPVCAGDAWGERAPGSPGGAKLASASRRPRRSRTGLNRRPGCCVPGSVSTVPVKDWPQTPAGL